jgi:hypothetical protein
MNDFFDHVQLILEIHQVIQDVRYEHIDVVILFQSIVVI